MTKKISISIAYTLIIVISTILLVSVVRAEDNTQSTTDPSLESSFTERKQKQLDAYKLEAEKKREEAKEQARQKVEEAKKEVDAKKIELRQKTCEARSEALKNKIEASSAAASKHQEKIDEFNKKVDAFVKKYNLSVANYDALTAVVATKSAESQQAVAALKSFPSSVDCSNVDAATASVIEYKALLATAKENLKEYRSATKDLLVAVKAAAESLNNGPATGSDSTEVN